MNSAFAGNYEFIRKLGKGYAAWKGIETQVLW